MLHTYPLEKAPIVIVQEGFKTEEEAVAVWHTLENKFEFKVKLIYKGPEFPGTTIAFTLEKCDPEDYRTYYKFGEIV
jgi:hypothetical protein